MKMSDDREELIRLLPEMGDRELPGGRQRQLQEFVMSQIREDLGTPARRRVRTGAVVATTAFAAAAAVTAVVVTTSGGTAPSTPKTPVGAPVQQPVHLSAVAQTFEGAASYAAARPFTAPGPTQWIYVANRNTADGSLQHDKGQAPVSVDRMWRRVDGTLMAGIVDGRFQQWPQESDYPVLSTLPTDPKAILDHFRTKLANAPTRVPAGPRTPRLSADQVNDYLFMQVSAALEDYVLPPAITAALWRAAALIPGVTQAPGTVSIGGRRLVAVGRVVDGWRFEQLLLDPRTHEFVGYRSVASRNIDLPVPSGPLHVRKGEVQFTITRLAATIVDRAGQTH
jgi:hypothetical protein